jgi:DNA-binding transcriptional ArsR family regulator
MDDNRQELWQAAALIGDPSRAAMLWSLMGGETRPASELALLANVSPQTASNHLRLLLEAGFLKVSAKGRNKFFRLSGAHIAAALESLALVAQPRPSPTGLARQHAPQLVFARTCYDHLAGELAVIILDRLRQSGHLQEKSSAYQLTLSGESLLGRMGMDVREAYAKHRRFAVPCLDWSQRVPHLGGALGAALLDWLLRSKSVVSRKTDRGVRLTESGKQQLGRWFNIRFTHSGAIAETGRSSG